MTHKKQKQAHKEEHAISQDSLNEEFGPEFGDPNAAKAFENAIEAKTQKNKKEKC
ncbi:hypothetical protein FIU87_07600 [Bacillus sp. THAF10]|uniref:hypothetical protein n=1 Tax=Bacillus sp. THAF10 TaxID=2587848 RepID=UPI0012A8A416|nr:hypothetical protein [Bacillus sp. THAF10]QFT88503.1 hypothetical protein FIU87_07600 [Bacillus sp. THAF10]